MTSAPIRVVDYRGPIPAGTEPVENLRRLCRRPDLESPWTPLDEFGAILILTRDNTGALTRLFGRQNRTHRREYAHRVWVLAYDGLVFHVYTGKRGTSYEIDLAAGDAPNIPGTETAARAAAFLARIRRSILSTPDGRKAAAEIRRLDRQTTPTQDRRKSR